MIRLFLVCSLVFASASTLAAPTSEIDEMQNELNSIDEELALEVGDEEFLDETKPKDKVVWGKIDESVQKPIKKAQAPASAKGEKAKAPQKSL